MVRREMYCEGGLRLIAIRSGIERQFWEHLQGVIDNILGFKTGV